MDEDNNELRTEPTPDIDVDEPETNHEKKLDDVDLSSINAESFEIENFEIKVKAHSRLFDAHQLMDMCKDTFDFVLSKKQNDDRRSYTG